MSKLKWIAVLLLFSSSWNQKIARTRTYLSFSVLIAKIPTFFASGFRRKPVLVQQEVEQRQFVSFRRRRRRDNSLTIAFQIFSTTNFQAIQYLLYIIHITMKFLVAASLLVSASAFSVAPNSQGASSTVS